MCSPLCGPFHSPDEKRTTGFPPQIVRNLVLEHAIQLIICSLADLLLPR